MMKKILSLSLFFVFTFLTQTSFAQTPQTSGTPPLEEDDGAVVKISTTLIQMDVIVTDKKGNQITDLKPEDFEIYENGKKQTITNLSYIFTNSPTQQTNNSPTSEPAPNLKNDIPLPPVKLRPEQVRRTYALVVDDLGLSFESVAYVKKALKKFVNEQIQDGDLVAIIRTGSGIGALQSFTTDRQQLFAAIDKIRWNPNGRGGISPFEPIGSSLKEDLSGKVDSDGNVKTVAGIEDENEFQDQINEFRQTNFASGTLGALKYIVQGMGELPGRKSVVLFSEGFQTVSYDGVPQQNEIFDSLRLLADFANRASVVFYTLDPRGLQVPGMANANDVVEIISPMPGGSRVGDVFEIREKKFSDTQASLRYLAYQTGGIPFVNRNNLNKGLEEVIEDQSGFYLIAYEPNEETFDPKKSRFNDLKIKVKRDGVNVRYRSGFFGIPTNKITSFKQTAETQIYSALSSPFGANDISLNLNAMFAEDAKNGMFIQSLVHIDGKDLKFTDETDGTKKANFDIIAMTFGDNGKPLDEASKNYTIKVSENNYQKILENGVIYSLLVPVKKPGAYQFRIALRDSASAKVGSATQFIEIPNLKKKRLTLSSIVLNNYSAVEWQKISSGRKIDPADGETEDSNINIDTALRKFKRGSVLQYGYIIYNAKVANRDSQLEIRARLLRDGKVILEGNPSSFDEKGQTDLSRLETAGAVTLGNNLQPGNYVFQVIVTDKLAKRKYQTSSRWVEFEIIE